MQPVQFQVWTSYYHFITNIRYGLKSFQIDRIILVIACQFGSLTQNTNYFSKGIAMAKRL